MVNFWTLLRQPYMFRKIGAGMLQLLRLSHLTQDKKSDDDECDAHDRKRKLKPIPFGVATRTASLKKQRG
jgi:hypothetical protein